MNQRRETDLSHARAGELDSQVPLDPLLEAELNAQVPLDPLLEHDFAAPSIDHEAGWRIFDREMSENPLFSQEWNSEELISPHWIVEEPEEEPTTPPLEILNEGLFALSPLVPWWPNSTIPFSFATYANLGPSAAKPRRDLDWKPDGDMEFCIAWRKQALRDKRCKRRTAPHKFQDALSVELPTDETRIRERPSLLRRREKQRIERNERMRVRRRRQQEREDRQRLKAKTAITK